MQSIQKENNNIKSDHTPILSIITINLNNADNLRKTIESVLTQTFNNYEYLIIDGKSSDNSVDVIYQFKDKINYWLSEPDNGIYSAMNKGILKATGGYLLFLNSGDCLTDNTVLSKVFEKANTADILYGHTNFIDKDLTNIRKATDESQLILSYFFNNSICHTSAFIAKRLFNAGLYDESYKISADKKFFIEKIIFQNCSVQALDIVVSNFNKEGISNKTESRVIIREENKRIFDQLIPSRARKDIDLYKNNYPDILTIVKIKNYKILYMIFKLLKKTTTFLQKY